MDESMGAADQPMDEDDRLRDLEGVSPLPVSPSSFSWDAGFPPFEPPPVDGPGKTPRAQGRMGEFDSIG